jgi:transposase-like protein
VPKRTYTDEQRQEALRLYKEVGPGEAARQLGIPGKTISSWAKRECIQSDAPAKMAAAIDMARLTREERREQLREKMLDKALDLLGRMDEQHKDFRGKDAEAVYWEKAPADACKNYATAAAILLDKFRLEVGEATGRTEHVGTAADRAQELLAKAEERKLRVVK